MSLYEHCKWPLMAEQVAATIATMSMKESNKLLWLHHGQFICFNATRERGSVAFFLEKFWCKQRDVTESGGHGVTSLVF